MDDAEWRYRNNKYEAEKAAEEEAEIQRRNDEEALINPKIARDRMENGEPAVPADTLIGRIYSTIVSKKQAPTQPKTQEKSDEEAPSGIRVPSAGRTARALADFFGPIVGTLLGQRDQSKNTDDQETMVIPKIVGRPGYGTTSEEHEIPLLEQSPKRPKETDTTAFPSKADMEEDLEKAMGTDLWKIVQEERDRARINRKKPITIIQQSDKTPEERKAAAKARDGSEESPTDVDSPESSDPVMNDPEVQRILKLGDALLSKEEEFLKKPQVRKEENKGGGKNDLKS